MAAARLPAEPEILYNLGSAEVLVERWADAVAREHGFDEVSHTVELFGRCGDCR